MQRYMRQDRLSSLLQTIYVKSGRALQYKVLQRAKLYTMVSNSTKINILIPLS